MKIFLYLAFFILLNLNAEEKKLDLKVFGTVGGVYNDNKDYIFRKNPFQKNGSSGDLDLYTDSIIGLQATYKFNDDFSFIAQSIAQKDYSGNNKTSIDWGYLKYDPSENFIFKIGRIRVPYYKNSNNQNIGYSKLMIREPIEVYGQFPFTAYNGIEFIYSNIINKYFYSIQANYGKEEFKTPLHSLNEELKNEIEDISALNFTFGNDIVEARATYMHGRTTTENNSLEKLFAGLKNSGIKELSGLASKYEMIDKSSQYFGLGLFIDYNNFIFSSEYGKRRVDAFYASAHGFYATLGYRFASFTPYISYAKIRMDSETIINTISPELNQLIKIQNLAQNSTTAGFKYYINQNLNFKFEYQKINPQGEYGGFYIDPTNEYPNTTSHIYSFVIDFVF